MTWGRVRGGSTVLAALVGVGMLLAVWILGSPPNSAPDEPANLLRGYSAGVGQWAGTPYDGHAGALSDQYRSFTVPLRLDVLNAPPCYKAVTRVAASCRPFFTLGHSHVATSPAGAYFPAMWFPLGLGERLAPSIDAADYAARAVSAVLAAALLVLAYACLRRRVERVGWLLAVAPLTLFTAASAATNGLEVCGAIAVLCGVRAVHGGDRRRGAVAFALGGLVLTTAKEAGPVWWVLLLALAAATYRFRGWAPRWPAWVLPVVGAVGDVVWTSRFLPSGSVAKGGLADQLDTAVHQVNRLPMGVYSRFGLLDTQVRYGLYKVGLAALVLFGMVCLVRSDWWRRGVIVAAVVVAWVCAVGFTVLQLRAGFGMQARFTLAMTAAVPLLAAFAVTASDRPPTRVRRLLDTPALVVLGAGAVAGELLAVYYNLKRYATGVESAGFLHHPGWVPPGGIALEVVLAVVGAAALAAAALLPRDRAEAASTPAPARQLVDA